MRLIGRVNRKDLGMYNSEFYYVQEVLEERVKVSETIDGEPLKCGFVPKSMFELGYATTVYKYQGSTIEGDYNVYDVDRMDANELYTALTRARKSAQVHLNYCTKKFRFAQEPPQQQRSTYNHVRQDISTTCGMMRAKKDMLV
jgi:hypothetical protein